MLIIRESNIRVELRHYRADTHLEIVTRLSYLAKLYKKSEATRYRIFYLLNDGVK